MLNVDAEQWRPVVALEGLYEVSSLGKVRSVDRLIQKEDVRGGMQLRYAMRRTGALRALYETEDGYMQVKLTGCGSVLVHTLVLEAFVGPCPPGNVARHLDDIGSNNDLKNLRWGTPKENSEDMVRNGNSPRGERHGAAKLNERDVQAIRARSREGCSSLGREFGVTAQAIRRVVSFETWRHVR